ncbi:MAG: phosphatase PAP2-related protein [Candidatus Paceibacterota bacterium]|jgi:hypothetical protein
MDKLKQLDLHTRIRDRAFLASSAVGLLMLTLSFCINYFAGTYATESISNQVSDLLLDRIPAWDVELLYVQGAVIMWTVVTMLLLYKPRYFPFFAKSMSLFILIRSFFIILTHIAPQHEIIPAANFFASKLTFGGDLFFSGHTGGPFLVGLVFWRNKYARSFFFFLSVIFGTAAILGHKHYSIDVFAAFFITYSIFRIAQYLFKTDYELIHKGHTVHGDSTA